ncbi:MAG TPA: YitT family protein [Chitinophagaceae bacterium]|nr:YitT family protein [Chitinophagaceae bacterium]
MQFEKAYSFLIKKLEEELPKQLTYHNVAHTREVIEATKRLAEAENIDGVEYKLLLTAALFHDAGFLEGDEHHHEKRSCDIARKLLPQYHYSQEEIEKVCKLIMATKMPQRPTDKLESILCDADLYYLGTERYLPVSEQLFVEWNNLGQKTKWEDWEKKQVSFLKTHKYFCKTAIAELTVQKSKNLQLYQENNRVKDKSKINKYLPHIKDFTLMILGVLTAAFALEIFLQPNNFLDGGITGIALLLKALYGVNLSITIIVLNLPFIIASYYVVSHRFAYKTLFSILLLGAVLLLMHEFIHFPTITKDPILVAVFGGFFLGLGSGLAMRGGCVLDGTEVLALYTFRKTSFTVSEVIFAANIVIFSVAALKFGIEISMYCLLTYFTASKTIDYVVEGIEEYTGVTIISGSSELIKTRLVNEMGKSITVYKGERGYIPGSYGLSTDCDIIFTVITRLELRRLKNLVYETDTKAFVFASTIKDASGGIIKHRGVH